MHNDLIIYDTSLRDGTQAENFNLSLEDKIRLTIKLDEFGIDFIEGGWPGASPNATEYFRKIKGHGLKHSIITAFGSTRNFKNKPEDDPNLKALVESGAPAITIFGKSWDIHVQEVLRIGMDDNLQIIEDSLAFLRLHVKYLFYDAEHFFDGYKNSREYALTTLDRAVKGGAECLILCDTNGGTLPDEILVITEDVKKYLQETGSKVELGIHAHNDSGTAVANSLLAVTKGATQIQGTMNGYGERCGNANLTSIIPALAMKKGYRFAAAENLYLLSETARYITELANLTHNRYQPYVGNSAFAHKGGIHVSAVKRNPLTYEHLDPEKVGNIRRILISDQSGRSNVIHKAGKFGIGLDSNDPAINSILDRLKTMEQQGYQFEGAEASFELLMRRTLRTCRNYFTLKGFRVINQKTTLDEPPQAEATIRLEVGGEMVHTAALGEGPVNALDNALRKALTRFYPALADMWLDDYRVRVLASEHGTGARVRVLIESRDHTMEWGTVGVSHDIIEASWQALVDSISYKLMKDERQRKGGC